MKNRIEIPNPCHEDWNKMTPNKNGRHCVSCDKTIVDFTKMTDVAIKSYFSKNADNKTCGHFYKGQLKSDKNKIQTFFTDIYCSAYLNIKTGIVRFAVLLLLGSVLTLVGCNTPTEGEMIERKKLPETPLLLLLLTQHFRIQ